MSDYSYRRSGIVPSLEKFHKLGLAMNVDFGDDPYKAWTALSGGLNAAHEMTFLDTTDWCLGQTPDINDAEEVEQMLGAAQSVWTVGPAGDFFELRRRVDPTVEEAAATAAPKGSPAEYHLSLAWRNSQARGGDPKAAYSEAVYAVEAAVHPK